MGKTILVTGGAGFVGSNLGILLQKRHSDFSVIALDNLKRRGSELNLKRLEESDVEFIHGDVRNKEDLSLAEIDLIVECSAEPSVLGGYDDSPEYLLNTNLVGTVNCLELARTHKADFIFLSTSRVYPVKKINDLDFGENNSRFFLLEKQDTLGASAKGITEDFPLYGARSLYGAAKLAAELIIQEYVEMYNIHAIINRCSVISGPWQMGKVDQGVFVYWMARHFFKQDLNYIGFGGKGKQVRDLLHVYDLFNLIDIQIQKISELSGQTFNVGGGLDCSLSLKEATKLCHPR